VVSSPNPLLEVKPTAGFDLDRSPEQIRYCLSEDIRVDAIKNSLDSSSQFEIDWFNSSVSDYQNLCSRYTYRPTAFEIVRNDVAARRSALIAEGLARLKSWRRLAPPPTATTSLGATSAPGHAYSPSGPPAADKPEILVPAAHPPPTNFNAEYPPSLDLPEQVITPLHIPGSRLPGY